jgi:hypothetical protein
LDRLPDGAQSRRAVALTLYLNCETCLKLYAEHAAALRHPVGRRNAETILNEIKTHEAAAHQKKKEAAEVAANIDIRIERRPID